MYGYCRLTAAGTSRELHIESALNVAHYDRSARIKMQPVLLSGGAGYEDRCMVACHYFVTRELAFGSHALFHGKTENTWIMLSSLCAEVRVHYGPRLQSSLQ